MEAGFAWHLAQGDGLAALARVLAKDVEWVLGACSQNPIFCAGAGLWGLYSPFEKMISLAACDVQKKVLDFFLGWV